MEFEMCRLDSCVSCLNDRQARRVGADVREVVRISRDVATPRYLQVEKSMFHVLGVSCDLWQTNLVYISHRIVAISHLHTPSSC